MRLGSYRFSFSIIPVVTVFLVFVGLIGLGVWQLARADEKRDIEASVRLVEQKVPFKLNNAKHSEPKTLLAEIYRSATALGRYDSKHQFLYDNRTHKGRPGYHVLSPFLMQTTQSLQDKNIAVLVNRGWIPFDGRRDNIQDITVEESGTVLKGVIKNPSQSIVLSDVEKLSNVYPQTIQRINLDSMGEKLGYIFLPIVIELDKSTSNGFVREWQPFYGSISKHTAYAVQWFSMAAVLLILFLKLSFKKED